MVPPALIKIGQPVTESDFTDLETDWAGPRQVPVAHNHHFAPPANEVRNEMHIKDGVWKVGKGAGRMLRSIKAAVISIAAFRQRLTKIIIENSQSLSGLVDRQ